MRLRRIVIVVVLLVVLLPLLALGVFLATFDPNAYKPEVIAAVKRATGRELTLGGPLKVAFSLLPTISVSDVRLANAPGASPASMLTLAQAEVRLALLPLLSGRLEIDRLILRRPRLILEVDKEGRPNWRFTSAIPSPSAQPAAPAGGRKLKLTFHSLRLTDGRFSYQNAQTGRAYTLSVASLTLSQPEAHAPLTLALASRFNHLAFTLKGTTGPLAAFSTASSRHPWPLDFALRLAGASLSVKGSIADPLAAKGYDFALDGTVPNFAALAPLAPGFVLPPLKGVGFSARLADRGGPLPALSTLELAVGPSDLAAWRPGLQLSRFDLTAASLDQPVQLAMEVLFKGQALSLKATTGPLGAFLAGARPSSWPVDLALVAESGGATVKGAISDPRSLGGANLALAADFPDLSLFSPLVGATLPKLTNVAFKGHLQTPEGGAAKGITLADLSLTAPQGNLAGTVTFSPGPRPEIVGALQVGTLDLDAVRRLFAPPTSSPAPQPAGAPAPASPYLIPVTPLPFRLLELLNTDFTLTASHLTLQGVSYSDLTAHLLLQSGKLTLSPFAIRLPGGLLEGRFGADATAANPAVSLSLTAPALEVAPMLAAYHLPPRASGNLEMFLRASGTGKSLHAIASGMNGAAGLAMVGGSVSGLTLDALLGEALHSAGLPSDFFAHQGNIDVRCFAARLDIASGQGRMNAFVLDSNKLYADGGGGMDFGAEHLALAFRPRIELSGQQVVLPVSVGGTFAHPKTGLARGNAALGTAANALAGHGGVLGAIGQMLGGATKASPPTGPSCAAALPLARDERAGPMPAQGAATPSPTAPAPSGGSGPLNLLHQYLP